MDPLPSARRANRGFTLVELLAVVSITAILALVGVSVFRHNVLAAEGSEAVSVIQALRSAEEAYSAENHGYFDVSTTNGGANWYPILVPGTGRSSWVQKAHPDYDKGWRLLAPAVNQPVRFSYLLNAGGPQTNVPALQTGQDDPGFPKPMPLDWYVIQARGDTNGNSVFAMYSASSRNSEIVIKNEGE